MKLRWLIRNNSKPVLQYFIDSTFEDEDGVWQDVETQVEITQ